MEIDGYRGDRVTFADTVQTSTASRAPELSPDHPDPPVSLVTR